MKFALAFTAVCLPFVRSTTLVASRKDDPYALQYEVAPAISAASRACSAGGLAQKRKCVDDYFKSVRGITDNSVKKLAELIVASSLQKGFNAAFANGGSGAYLERLLQGEPRMNSPSDFFMDRLPIWVPDIGVDALYCLVKTCVKPAESANDPVYVPNPVEAPVSEIKIMEPPVVVAPVERRFMTTVEMKQSVTLDELTEQVNSGVVALSNSHCDETTCMQSVLKPIIISKEAKALAGIIAAAHLTDTYMVQDIVAQLMVIRSDTFMQMIRDTVRPEAVKPLACGLQRFKIPALLGVEVC